MAICGLYANDQRETEQGAALIAAIGTDSVTISSIHETIVGTSTKLS